MFISKGSTSNNGGVPFLLNTFQILITFTQCKSYKTLVNDKKRLYRKCSSLINASRQWVDSIQSSVPLNTAKHSRPPPRYTGIPPDPPGLQSRGNIGTLIQWDSFSSVFHPQESDIYSAPLNIKTSSKKQMEIYLYLAIILI